MKISKDNELNEPSQTKFSLNTQNKNLIKKALFKVC
jgi:hypothetical protein